ncbi:MAG: prepilin-type N-terminal cleavage/methylation domain-containing protein [Nitrospiraceae bacterium]|nr:prepilin-type N-terminal cleavage/methylation domain-containing protein [Nitrospiraceae bacterium]
MFFKKYFLKTRIYKPIKISFSRERGFTLVELLVSITVFAAVIAGATQMFSSSIKGQLITLKSQNLLNETSYLTEYMSRSLRMAQQDIDGKCISKGKNYATSSGQVTFMNYKGLCQSFKLENSAIKVAQASSTDDFVFANLTSPDLDVSSLNFDVRGDEKSYQPKVTFALTIGNKSGYAFTTHFQTSVSQRDLNATY